MLMILLSSESYINMSKNGDSRNIRVLQFLDAYEKQECLWNPLLESYKNKLARDESYMHIIRELNNPALTIHDIKLKVKSIRTTYTKELRLLTKNKEEGKSYIPKLFWFNRANAFLKSVSLSRDKRVNTKNNLTSSEYKHCGLDYIDHISIQQNIDEEQCGNISNEVGVPPNTISYEYKTIHTSSIKNANQENIPISILSNKQNTQEVQVHTFQPSDSIETKFTTSPPSELSNNYCQQNTQGNACEDEYDFFCRSVAVQLRSITDTYSRSVAKLKIQQILFEAETGHYRNSPCITIPVSEHLNSL